MAAGEVSPMPTFPFSNTCTRVVEALLERANNWLVPVPNPVTCRRLYGETLPMPILPLASTRRLVPVVDPTANWATPGSPWIENIAYGVEVPTPTLGNPPDDPTETRVEVAEMPFWGVVLVAIAQALMMLEATVEVADPRYTMVVEAAVEEEI